ncbi:MAG: hypothetical protein H6R38_208 [Deltaproteobacteria bacterium]|nr:hypothetical protein [Deltaproteobacteria bacterium]
MKPKSSSPPPDSGSRTGLNSREATPLYEKLRTILSRQIEEGLYQPDEVIPSERELCRQYHISRITVRQAIAEMINEGVLYRKQGKGTFVARRKVNQGLSRIVTFSRTVMDIGMKPSTRILFQGLLPAGLEVASILKLPDAGQALKLVLLGLGDHRPLVVYESYFPPPVGKKMLREAVVKEKQGVAFSSYDLYGKNTGIFPARVNQAATTRPWNSEEPFTGGTFTSSPSPGIWHRPAPPFRAGPPGNRAGFFLLTAERACW